MALTLEKFLPRLVIAVANILVLSSCGLLPSSGWGIRDDSERVLNARMEQIAEALNDHDAAALKALFSPYALEQAPDIDGGLEYLFSLFPDGGVTWTYSSSGYEGDRSDDRTADLLVANFDVSAQ